MKLALGPVFHLLVSNRLLRPALCHPLPPPDSVQLEPAGGHGARPHRRGLSHHEPRGACQQQHYLVQHIRDRQHLAGSPPTHLCIHLVQHIRDKEVADGLPPLGPRRNLQQGAGRQRLVQRRATSQLPPSETQAGQAGRRAGGRAGRQAEVPDGPEQVNSPGGGCVRQAPAGRVHPPG